MTFAKCKICGVIFRIAPSRIKKGRGKTCSKKCANKLHSISFSKEKHPGWKGGKIKANCVYCGKEIYKHLCLIEGSKNNFCNKSCYWKWHKGKNNSGWKGGKSSVYSLIRETINGYKWRAQVFKRDNYKCVECGKHGTTLNAHHIKHFMVLIKEMGEEDTKEKTIEKAINYLPLWDVSNGMTLCRSCHKEKHRRRI